MLAEMEFSWIVVSEDSSNRDGPLLSVKKGDKEREKDEK